MLDVQRVPYVIPGAIRIDADEVDRRHAEMPRDREIVLYCT
jgi:rhodanese-related sulfurtransferase